MKDEESHKISRPENYKKIEDPKENVQYIQQKKRNLDVERYSIYITLLLLQLPP